MLLLMSWWPGGMRPHVHLRRTESDDVTRGAALIFAPILPQRVLVAAVGLRGQTVWGPEAGTSWLYGGTLQSSCSCTACIFFITAKHATALYVGDLLKVPWLGSG
jgi:hypothetical protein